MVVQTTNGWIDGWMDSRMMNAIACRMSQTQNYNRDLGLVMSLLLLSVGNLFNCIVRQTVLLSTITFRYSAVHNRLRCDKE